MLAVQAKATASVVVAYEHVDAEIVWLHFLPLVILVILNSEQPTRKNCIWLEHLKTACHSLSKVRGNQSQESCWVAAGLEIRSP